MSWRITYKDKDGEWDMLCITKSEALAEMKLLKEDGATKIKIQPFEKLKKNSRK